MTILIILNMVLTIILIILVTVVIKKTIPFLNYIINVQNTIH